SFELAEDPLEIAALIRQDLRECLTPSLLVAREDHLAHSQYALFGEEHVLGAAQSDAVSAEQPRHASVLGRIRIRTNAQSADLVRPLEEAIEVPVDLGVFRLHALLEQHLDAFGRPRLDLAGDDLAGRSVDGQPDAFLERLVAVG